jgi:hypothetical protein
MTVQYSTTVRNAFGDTWESTIGTSAKLRIYSGAQPANCAASETGTLLAEFPLASDWSAAASAGAKTLSSLPLSTTGAASGTAAHYRIYDSAAATCHEQGSVGTSGADLTIDNTSINSGQTVQVTGFTKTWPGA